MSTKKMMSNKQQVDRDHETGLLYPVAEKATLYNEHTRSNEELNTNHQKKNHYHHHHHHRQRDLVDTGVLPKVSGLTLPSVKTDGELNLLLTHFM